MKVVLLKTTKNYKIRKEGIKIKPLSLFINIQLLLESLIEEVKAIHKEILEVKTRLDDFIDVLNLYKESIAKDDNDDRKRISINGK